MKNIIYIIACTLFFSGKGQNKNDVFLLPYKVGEKWGLADTLGEYKS
ncbi:hypothetical protein [uncultured Chryseobacterium sp.]|nr:hypothetical protein [uncultured Chryseobacterium sp.]